MVISMKKRKNLETIALALSLFLLSGIGIGYNIYTAEEGELSVSVSRFIEYWQTPGEYSADGDILSDYTRACLMARDSISVFATKENPDRDYQLLPPIITPPEN